MATNSTQHGDLGSAANLELLVKKFRKIVMNDDTNDKSSAVTFLEDLNRDLTKTDREVLMYVPEKLGRNMINLAIESGREDLVRLMIEKFDVDINDDRLACPRPPLHTACKEGNLDIVELLLSTDIEFPATSEPKFESPDSKNREGSLVDRDLQELSYSLRNSPILFVLKYDRRSVLEFLFQRGFGYNLSFPSLLLVAVDLSSPHCTEYLASEAVTTVKEKERILLHATKKGIAVVKTLLGAGFVFSEHLLENNRTILNDYYSNSGMDKENYESSCAEFTKILLTYSSDILSGTVDILTIHCLLLRMCQLRKFLQRHGPDSVDIFYDDIEETVKLLLELSPNLCKEITSEMFHTYLNTIKIKAAQSKYEKWETVRFIRLVLLLTAKGYEIGFDELTAVLDIQPNIGHQLFPHTIGHFVYERLSLLDYYLSRIYFLFKVQLSWRIWTSLKNNSVVHVLRYNLLEVPIFYRHGVTIYDFIKENGPESYFLQFTNCLVSQHAIRSHGEFVITYFILLIKDWVDFTREQESGSLVKAFTTLILTLLNINVTSQCHYTQCRTAESLLLVFFYLLHFLHPQQRIQFFMTFNNIYRGGNAREGCQLIINGYVTDLIHPLIHNISLKDLCIVKLNSMIKKSVIDFPSAVEVEFPSRSAITEEPQSWVTVFDFLKYRGFYYEDLSGREKRIHQLPLPVSLRQLLTRNDVLEFCLCNLWKSRVPPHRRFEFKYLSNGKGSEKIYR